MSVSKERRDELRADLNTTDEVHALLNMADERDALLEAINEIADGFCCETPGCGADDPCCEVGTARAAQKYALNGSKS